MSGASTLIRQARESGYRNEKVWLANTGFEFYETYAQWVVIADLIKRNNGTRERF
jgi:hypothetical protein